MALGDGLVPGRAQHPLGRRKGIMRTSGRTERSDAPIGGPLTPSPIPWGGVPVFVVARTRSTPGMLSEHGYTIVAEGERYELTWRDLWVPVSFAMVNPSATRNSVFGPAAVVGDAEHAEQPWRAQGVLFRMPDFVGGETGSSTAMVHLWGLSLELGCS